MTSMLISGAFAGLAGAMEGLGTFEYAAVKGAFTGVGFDGIAVALLGGNTAVGVVLAACLLGGLKIGALNMPIESGVPSEVVDIVIAIIILFVASSYAIRFVMGKLKKKGGELSGHCADFIYHCPCHTRLCSPAYFNCSRWRVFREIRCCEYRPRRPHDYRGVHQRVI